MPPPPQQFADLLAELHTAAGRPSSRKVAAAAGGLLSHTTVAALLSGGYLHQPSWSSVSAIVTALGGDPDTVLPIWKATYPTARTGRAAYHPVHARPTAAPAPTSDVAAAIDRLAAAIESLADVIKSRTPS